MGENVQKRAIAPIIRFAGFTDSWEQRKLSELTFPAGIKNKDNLPLTSYSITNENGFIMQDVQFENGGSMKSADKRMYYIVKPGSFAYNPARINVGSIGYYNGDKDVIVSSLYEVFKTDGKLDDKFLWCWLKTRLFQRAIESLQEGGVRLYFYYDKLCMTNITIPSVGEQRKIGNILSRLDSYIVLHQRKLDAIKRLKKSLLQKMFPSNGESKPTIRFAGFTDSWEQRKAGDVFDFGVSNNTLSRDQLTDASGEINDVHYGDVLIKYGFILNVATSKIPYLISKSIKINKSDLLHNGDIIMADTAEDETVGKSTEIQGISNQRVLAGLHTIVMRPKKQFGDFYLGFFINSSSYHNQLKPLMQGIKVTSLTRKPLLETSINFPLSLAEQVKIGLLLNGVDNSIVLHQRKLDELQKVKKSLLQKMFI